MKAIIGIALVVGFILSVAAALVYLTSPRMYVQPHFRTYQRVAPPLPEGVVVAGPAPAGPTSIGQRIPLPSVDEAKSLANPEAATAESLARGKVYYAYYCVFCHGEKGDGNGPVGESYTPIPTDLRADKLRTYSDGQLYRAMLTGIGHDPVLDYTVLPEHRWHLVNYVRALSAESQK